MERIPRIRRFDCGANCPFGGLGDGSIHGAAKTTSLDQYPVDISDANKHMEVLFHALATYGECVWQAIDQCNEFKDMGTADIFTEISRGIDKKLWFFDAHLQSSRKSSIVKSKAQSAVELCF